MDGAQPERPKMPTRLVVRCEKCGGVNEIHFPTEYTPRFVQLFAGLLDGSSPLFKAPVGQDSVVGRCCKCQGRLVSRVVS